jgi:hypothetical protein
MTALTAFAPRLNPDVFRPPFDPPPTDPGHTPIPDPRGLLDKLALNPQPLPPRSGGSMLSDDFCGTVPRWIHRFPPPPPPPVFTGLAR